jgi:uncharacterized protein (TIGR03435 family)
LPLIRLLFTLTLAVASLHAQTITGTWQGTVPVPPENLRTVLKISKSPDGSLRGAIYRIDRSPEGIPLSTVTFQPPDFTAEQIYANFAFHGALNPDGKSITGTCTQEKQSYPVTFTLATPDTIWKAPGPTPVPPMSPDADPAFEVATIKPSPPDAKGWSYGTRTRQFAAKNQTVEELMKFAWDLRDRQFQGAPAWFSETKFDIAAEPDTPGLPSLNQYRLMLRKLLADRFKLKTHTIQPIFPVYALTIDKNPPKLTPTDPEFGRESIYTKGTPDGQTLVHFLSNTMQLFIGTLMNFIPDRQIVDETGLTGRFDFDIILSADFMQPNSSADDKANAFIQAIQPLGFKLVPKKAPLDVLVIDHVEKPSAN